MKSINTVLGALATLALTMNVTAYAEWDLIDDSQLEADEPHEVQRFFSQYPNEFAEARSDIAAAILTGAPTPVMDTMHLRVQTYQWVSESDCGRGFWTFRRINYQFCYQDGRCRASRYKELPRLPCR